MAFVARPRSFVRVCGVAPGSKLWLDGADATVPGIWLLVVTDQLWPVESPIGDDSARLPDFCEFQNGVICGSANAMTPNSGAHNFPTTEWGVHIRYNATQVFYLQTGVYHANPDEGNSDKGFDLSFRSTGRFIPVEPGWQTGDDTLPGTYKLGAYYNSSETPDVYEDINGMPAGLTGVPFIQHNGRWGAYGIASRALYPAAIAWDHWPLCPDAWSVLRWQVQLCGGRA